MQLEKNLIYHKLKILLFTSSDTHVFGLIFLQNENRLGLNQVHGVSQSNSLEGQCDHETILKLFNRAGETEKKMVKNKYVMLIT